MKIKHYGRVTDKGKLELSNPDGFKAEVSKLAGKRVYLTVQDDRPKRSNDQNEYYWGLCLKLISDHTGHTVDELHDILKYKFLGAEEKTIAGETVKILKSTTKLNTLQFEEYLGRIREWASTKLNVVIPLPNEVTT